MFYKFILLKIKKAILPMAIALLCVAQVFSQNRTIVDFNSNWKFCKCDGSNYQSTSFSDASWDAVSTPHTWNNIDGQDGGGDYYRGIGWYRKNFTVANGMNNKRIYLKFNAAAIRTEVYINGNHVGDHKGSYSAFVFDVTDIVNKTGNNLLAVKVNNADTILAPPLSADFTFHGGITRSVELIYVDPVHISLLDYGSPGVYITQDNVSNLNADIYIKTLVRNTNSTSSNVTASFEIADKSGAIIKTLTSNSTLNSGEQKTISSSTSIANPHLWNGLTDPYLYSVTTKISVNGNVVDQVVQPLGIRYYSVDINTGFYLNGSSYRLHGVAHHEERVNKGSAVSDTDRKQDLDILKNLGCNYIRLSHYQHGNYTYNYCDSVGIALWTEIPLINNINGTSEFSNNAKQQLMELIYQNYNHPSVIVWGLSNEITYKQGPDPAPLVLELNNLAHQIDSTRLTASAAMYPDAGLNFYSDIYSCNVYNGWYYNTYNDFGPWATSQHSKYPSKGFGVSEYGAGANVLQHEPLNPAEPANYGPWHPEEYQALFHEAHWQQMVARPFLWSTSVWVGFDFASDGRNEGQQPGINDKGLVTRDRLTKKDAYYFYQANWSNKPMVYITSRRFTVRYDSVVTAKVYSNCDSVILKVNTTSLAKKTSTNGIFTWNPVNLVRGVNTITTVGYKNGIAYYDTCYWSFKGPYIITPAPAPIQINFETLNTVTPTGYMKDAGNSYGDRGNGYTYGWNQSITSNGRERNTNPMKIYDTFIHMQLNNGYNFWEIELPEGHYKVSIGAGDPLYFDSYNAISAENKLIIKEPVYSSKRTAFGSDTVYVNDGRLTIRPATGSGAINAKIDFIHIAPVIVNATVSPLNKTELLIFPNPSSDNLTIYPLSEIVSIRLMNAQGTLVREYNNITTETFSIPSSELEPGIYLFEITGEHTHYTTKVFIE
jgi:beta-galactosidase